MTLRVLLSLGFSLLATAAFAAAPFEGHYRAAGKDAKLNFVLATKSDPFFGKPVTQIVFSEKDGSKESNPRAAAQMGHLGDAIAIKLMQDSSEWSVIGAELSHAASPKQSGASVSGKINVSDVKVANGELSGHFTTDPGAKVFGDSFDVDLKFHVKQP